MGTSEPAERNIGIGTTGIAIVGQSGVTDRVLSPFAWRLKSGNLSHLFGAMAYFRAAGQIRLTWSS